MLVELKEEPIATAQAQTGRTKYQTIVKSGGHQLLVDEPEEVGGANAGMDPQGLLLASLGSCTAITLRMYVDRKIWPVDEITVNLELYKTETGTLIKRLLNFKGEISAIQKDRLIQIANACPIHKILIGNIDIESVLE